MAGHRRISTDLFLEFVNDPAQRWKVAALLEVDLDEWKGNRLSIHAYARKWGRNRVTVRRLLAQYDEKRGELYSHDMGGFQTGTRPKKAVSGDHRATTQRPASDPPNDPQSSTIPVAFGGANDPPNDRAATTGRPSGDPILEPEPEPGGESVPPVSPSALRGARSVGPADARRRQAEKEVERALEWGRGQGVTEERIEAVRPRFEALAQWFLGFGRVADEAQLRAYFKATREFHAIDFRAGLDEAAETNENERGFAPSAAKVRALTSSIATTRRKAARKGNA